MNRFLINVFKIASSKISITCQRSCINMKKDVLEFEEGSCAGQDGSFVD